MTAVAARWRRERPLIAAAGSGHGGLIANTRGFGGCAGAVPSSTASGRPGGGAGALLYRSPTAQPDSRMPAADRQPPIMNKTHVPGTIRGDSPRPAAAYIIPPIGIGHAQAGIRDSQQNTAFAADWRAATRTGVVADEQRNALSISRWQMNDATSRCADYRTVG